MRLSDQSIKTTSGDIAERNRDMHLLYHISGEEGDFCGVGVYREKHICIVVRYT